MFEGGAIQELIDLLMRRQASLFHAVQFLDFQNYLELGGIPSRAYQHAHCEGYTLLATDDNDKANGVWDKVFVNLADFGREFAQGTVAVPNAFGPITLQLKPNALLEADDVAICLRSAGAAGFRREQEALKSIAEIDGLFVYPAQVGFPDSIRLRSRRELERLRPRASIPEVSLTIPSGRLGLEHTIVLWVDPYIFGGKPLFEYVDALVTRSPYQFLVRERSCLVSRRPLYNEIAALIQDGNPHLTRWEYRQNLSPALRQWGRQIMDAELGYQYDRFARYLMDGTLAEMGNAC
jgi:hypothetical protein